MKNMKIRRIALISALCIAILFTIAAGWTSLSHVGNTVVAEVGVVAEPYKYLLSSHNGYVAVFVAGNVIPSYITDTAVSTLPTHDRDLLERGIPIYTEDELSAALEDYES